MMRRWHILVISLVIMGTVSGCHLLGGGRGGATATPASPQATVAPGGNAFSFPGYNVLLVGFDALRPDHTTVYGYKRDTTPHLAAFAREAYVFKRAYSAASWTLPSFMSVFTALYPTVHGVTNKWTPMADGKIEETRLSANVTTLPQLLKKQGYALAAFTGDAGISAKYGFGRDFDVFLDDVKFGGLDHSIPACLAWLEKNSSKPWFVFLHGYDVHGQYDPPQGYTRRYAKDYHGTLKGDKREQAIFREEGLRVALKPGSIGEPRLDSMSAEDGRFYADLYDEKIHDADERFGNFLARLQAMGQLERTIIVVISDHGEEFLDHGHIDHGHTLYDEQTHVCLMIRFPNQKTRHDIDDPVSLMDTLPTVLACLGIPVSLRTDGISLLPVLRGEHTRRNLYAETDYRLFVHKRSVRDERYKFIYNLVTKKRELYDLTDDPKERKNLATRNPAVASAMEQDLMQWLRSMNTPVESYENRKEDYVKEF